MMQRLLQIKDALSLYASKHKIPQISPEDWLDIEKCVSILKPFEETTKILSSSQASISSVIPLIHVLKSALQEEEKANDTSQIFKNIIGKLTEELNVRFSELQNNNIFALATYLDPRYKLKFFNEIYKEKVQSEMLCLISDTDISKSRNVTSSPPSEKRQRLNNLCGDNPQPSTSSQIHLTKSVSTINTLLANILHTNADEDEEADNSETLSLNQFMVKKALLSDYNKEKILNIDEDPLLWWKQNSKYQRFYNTVRQYLSPPPASVPSEQLFSGAGLIYDELRNRLKGDKAAILLFIKYNLPVLNFEY